MRGSKKGNKTLSENLFEEKSKAPQSSSTKGGTPPSPKCNAQRRAQNRGM